METVSLRKFGKQIGKSAAAVSKAISRGRLTEKSVCIVNGQPVIRDANEARLEWAVNRRKTSSSLRPIVRQDPLRAELLAVSRTENLVTIHSLDSTINLATPALGAFVASAHAADFGVFEKGPLLSMSPATARELARILLLKSDAAPGIDNLPE